LEAFFSEEDDSLAACLYAVAPAVDATLISPSPAPPEASTIQPIQPIQPIQGPSPSLHRQMTAHQIDCSGVTVTAEMLMSVFDVELEQWGLLFRGTLTPRTGFQSDGGAVSSAARYAGG
jgi:hypothetical protein